MSNDQPPIVPGSTPDSPPTPDVPPTGRPQYGEYAPAGSAPAPTPQQPRAESTGSAAESVGGVGAFVGGSYPQVVATYTKYEDAQASVDRLSDEGFPVENVSIVGHDIRTVENVSGRVTNRTAAVRGIGSGAWFGLLAGFLFGFFIPGDNFFIVVITAVVLGAIWGALFGFVGHAATRGRRDFSSIKTMEAGRYEVLVRGEFAARASQMLADHVYK